MTVIAHLSNIEHALTQQCTFIRKCIVLLSLLSAVLLTGCGFQLRGYGANPIALEAVAIKFAADAPSGQWDFALRRQLAQSGIDLSDDAQTLLTLREIKSTKDIVSYDSRGKAAEYELVQTVSITIESRTETPGKTAYHNTLKKSRVYTFDPENITGKSQEERLLTREIQAELIRDIIQRLGDYSQQSAASSQLNPNTSQPKPAR